MEESIQHPGFKTSWPKAPFVRDILAQDNVYSAGKFEPGTIRRCFASMRDTKNTVFKINDKNDFQDRYNKFVYYSRNWGPFGKYALDDHENIYDRWKPAPYPMVDPSINYMSSRNIVNPDKEGLRTGGNLYSSFVDKLTPVKTAV